MKIVFTITPDEQREAFLAFLSDSEKRQAYSLWLRTKGIDFLPADYEIDIAPAQVAASLPPVLATPPAPIQPPVAPVPGPVLPPVPTPTPGHSVIWDPPLSATGNAAMCGLGWNGMDDPGDNGIGFFEDRASDMPYNTRSLTLMGVSLPREVLMETFGMALGPWTSNFATSVLWSKHSSQVQGFVTVNNVFVTIDCNGKTANLPLVDASPKGWNPSTGEPLGNLADLTYGAAHWFGTNGLAVVTLAILANNKPLSIKGWDQKQRRVA